MNNNVEQNNLNMQSNNGMIGNQQVNSNQIIGYDTQTGQPIYGNQNPSQNYQNFQPVVENKSKKKKKYWLIPIFVFLVMVISMVIKVSFSSIGVNFPIINFILSFVYLVCGFAVIPSIILAIVLSCVKN